MDTLGRSYLEGKMNSFMVCIERKRMIRNVIIIFKYLYK